MENVITVSPINRNGFCVSCTMKTAFVCQRCADFYCSKECQIRDWQRHRYICFSIPALVHPSACSAISNVNVQLPIAALETLQNETKKNDRAAATNSDVIVAQPNIEESVALPTKVFTQRVVTPSVALPSVGPQFVGQQLVVPPSVAPPIVSPNVRINADEGDKKNISNPILPKTNANGHNSSNHQETTKFLHPPKVGMPPTKSLVRLTGFRSPNICYIREISDTVDQAYVDLFKKLDLIGKHQPITNSPNKQYYALSYHNGVLQRIKVVSKEKKSMRIFYMDIGILKLQSSYELREINSELLELPCYTLAVQLKDVPNYALSSDFNNFLWQFEGKSLVLTYEKQSGVCLWDGNQSINQKIIEYGKASQSTIYDKNMSLKGPEAVLCKILPNLNITEMQNFKKNNQINKAATEQQSLNVLPNNAPPMSDAKANVPNNANAIEKPIDNQHSPKPYTDFLSLLTEAQLKKGNHALSSNDSQAEIKSSSIAKPEDKRMLIPPFTMQRLNIKGSDGIDVFIVENESISKGIIGAFDSECASDFSELHSRLSNFKDTQPYKPVPKEYVIAKLDGFWHRGRVTEIFQKEQDVKYNIKFLEFTNVSTVTERDIRRYPLDLTTPCHTNICLIDDFPHQLNAAQKNYLNEKMQKHCLLHVDNVSYIQDMAVLKCKYFSAELKKLI